MTEEGLVAGLMFLAIINLTSIKTTLLPSPSRLIWENLPTFGILSQ